MAEREARESPMIRFGIYLPNVGWEGLPTPSELVEFALAAEQMGFDSVWVEDRFLHSGLGVLEALSTLTFVAARTEKIRLGTSILLVNLRNPLLVAKMLSTLDYLSGGRVVVGASLGGSPQEYSAAGVTMKTRVTRFAETLRAMRAFWGQGSFQGVSRFFQPADLPMEPKPVQSRIPVWIGGKAEPVFKRVATLGDGWLASSSTSAEEFAHGWAKVREHAAAAGKDPDTLVPAKFCYIHIESTAEKALQVLRERLPRYYAFPYDAARLTLYGPPSHCAEHAQTLLGAGVRTLILSLVTNDLSQLERVAHEVLPELRRTNSSSIP
ncbi:MAG: LLM class flavin-dependent oxidoreductase [Deltaproteobacteria bacterium]|nr:LLM class flavin-dependent oxidoreductase [Deltaproteobacteria bacterium]